MTETSSTPDVRAAFTAPGMGVRHDGDPFTFKDESSRIEWHQEKAKLRDTLLYRPHPDAGRHEHDAYGIAKLRASERQYAASIAHYAENNQRNFGSMGEAIHAGLIDTMSRQRQTPMSTNSLIQELRGWAYVGEMETLFRPVTPITDPAVRAAMRQ